MKSSLLLLSLLTVCLVSYSQSVGIGTSTPNPSAQVDITSSTKGLLIPRMSTTAINAIPSPAKGLMVYDSVKNQVVINTGSSVAPAWQVTAAAVSWGVGGNNGINPSNQFIGNVDNQPLRFRINNILSGELHPVTGNVYWGLLAGSSNTTGASNIAIGNGALRSNTIVSNLVAIGDSALFHEQGNPLFTPDGTFNTAVGSKAMFSNTSGAKNTAIGYNSLFTNVSGSFNTAVGNQSLFANTSGVNNTAIGFHALFSNTGGAGNTAIGNISLVNNTSGNNNIAIGDNTMTGNTTGQENTGVGQSALTLNTTGSFNTAVGRNALVLNSDGHDNTGLGWEALFSNTNGIENTAIGSQALFSNTGAGASDNTAIGFKALFANTGIFNTATGSQSLMFNTSGVFNTANGVSALQNNTTGSSNTALGSSALSANTTGSLNTAIGINALSIATNAGTNNTAVGASAGGSISVGSANTFIGAQATSIGAVNNSTAIGALSTVNRDNMVMIGSTSTTSINGFVNFSVISDGRFKKNITEDVKGIDFIMKLRPVTYQLDVSRLSSLLNESRGKEMDPIARKAISDKEQTTVTGFIAQEVEQAAKATGYNFSGVDKPKNENDLYAIRYSEFVVPLVKGMQEQQKQIEELKKQNEAALQIIKELRNAINELKRK